MYIFIKLHTSLAPFPEPQHSIWSFDKPYTQLDTLSFCSLSVLFPLYLIVEINSNNNSITFLNQGHTDLRPVHTWFLIIAFVRTSVCMCVCVPTLRLLIIIISGVRWRDIDPIWLVKQVLQPLYGSYNRYG